MDQLPTFVSLLTVAALIVQSGTLWRWAGRIETTQEFQGHDLKKHDERLEYLEKRRNA